MDNKEKSEGSGRKHPLAWPDGHIYHDKSIAEFFNDIQNQIESISDEKGYPVFEKESDKRR